MSAYASLLNIDLNLPDKLIIFILNTKTNKDDSELLDFQANANRFLIDRDIHNFLCQIFDNVEDVFNNHHEEDIESFIQATISVLYTIEGDLDTKTTVNMIVSNIIKGSTNPRLRLKALISLLNLVIENEVKYEILVSLFEYSQQSNQHKLVYHLYKQIDNWVINWKLTDIQSRLLYQLIFKILSSINENSISLIYLIKYLNTFKDESYPIEVEQIATTALVSAIKSPVASFADRNALLESFQKQKTPQGDLLHLIKLLTIICTDKLDAFSLYLKNSKEILEKYSINPTDIQYNMRLMTLCAIGCEKTNLTYKEIAKALEVYDEDVENWVVEAVGQGLMTAQIDQTASAVCVSRSAHRSFGIDQWKSLQQKLKSLKSKVNVVVESIKKHSI